MDEGAGKVGIGLVVKILDHNPAPSSKANPRILYIGPVADEICDLVSPHIGAMQIDYASGVEEGLKLAREVRRDVIIVDQRDAALATKLVLPLLDSLDYEHKLVVVATLSTVGAYLRIPGVARVISAPVRESQLIRILGLNPNKRRHDKIKLADERTKEEAASAPLSLPAPTNPHPEAAHTHPPHHATEALPIPPDAKPPVVVSAPKKHWSVYISDFGMKLVSIAYKRLAFFLLGALFISFAFYGVLIGFYLVSDGWAMPQHLSLGRPSVDKTAREIVNLEVAYNSTKQRINEAQQRQKNSMTNLMNAQAVVAYANDTAKKEITDRKTKLGVVNRDIARTLRVQGSFDRQLAEAGMEKNLAKLYARRLIEKRSLESGVLGLLETGQRVEGMKTKIDQLQADKAHIEQSIDMLNDLQLYLRGSTNVANVNAATSELLLLTKQALDARTILDTARGDYLTATKALEELTRSNDQLQTEIALMESSTYGRATKEPVDVLFVPYTNTGRYVSGAPLYSCRLTMILCWRAGVVGEAVPGEVHMVHPFFGKPIRGSFVEVVLTDPEAVNKEVIHAGHAPFYLF